MKRLTVFVQSAAIVLAASFAASDASASHPDVLRHYSFIPSRSTLEVTGGFAGLELTFFPHGDFGLVTGYRSEDSCLAIGVCPPPDHIPYAQFVDVEAWLVPDSPLTYIWWLDETLNFSGLHGTFHHDNPERLLFHGEEGQGHPFRLEATVHGRFLHLVGENDPDCCDFFHYKLDALAVLKPHGDLNRDDVIDAADFVLWRKSGGAHEEYTAWRSEFGTNLASEAAAAVASHTGALHSTAVPEPAALSLVILAALTLAPARRRP
jgi:hypothetical protein